MSRLFVFAAALALCAGSPVPASAARGADLLQALRQMQFEPSRCYRISELNFTREDVKLYLTAGHLMFANAIEGRTIAAVFVADVEGGDAEVLLVPPNRAERQSLAQFTQSPTLASHFGAALLLFSDDTGTLLQERLKEQGARVAPDRGALLSPTWNPVLRNISEGFQLRLAQDLLSTMGGAAPRFGMFFAALQVPAFGNIELLVDPRSRDQIVAGQTAHRDNRTMFDVWTNFPSRTQRNKQTVPAPTPDVFHSVRLEAEIAESLHLRVTTKATLIPSTEATGVIAFDLARQMRITSVKIDGQPAEVLQREEQRMGRGREDETFLVVPAAPLKAGEKHEIELQHEGDVIHQAGRQVYFVNARATWYPRPNIDYSHYDLIFRYPRRFDLVATGARLEDKQEGETRISHFRTPVAVRHVGFNLGIYDKTSVTRNSYTVDVYANKSLEPNLQPQAVVLQPIGPPRPPGRRIGPAGTDTSLPVVPKAVSVRDTLASEVADAFAFMAGRFGPLPWRSLTVSPVPAAFGQGFPGLIYLSTLAYLNPEDRPAGVRSEMQNLFFTDLLLAHETAHQWWGNTVAPATSADDWLVEALANYSAMMWVEKKRGPAALDKVLAAYRDNLVRKNQQGRSIESYGPIIWGARLRQTSEPEAWRVITYEKGSWIIHMLRRRLGDERFFRLLTELRKRYEGQPVSTAQFQQLAQQFLPANSPERNLDNFFEQWVYGTGIPSLKLQASAKGPAPKVKVSGTLQQGDVDEDFTIYVPVQAVTPRGPAVVHWVPTGSDPAAFSFATPAVPAKILLDPDNSVLKR